MENTVKIEVKGMTEENGPVCEPIAWWALKKNYEQY